MKYSILEFIRTVIATLTAFIMSLSGLAGGSIGDTDGNAVTSYNKDKADYTLDIDTENEIHDISELLFGIFFEDINFAADGGLYAEKIANRSFEYTEIAENDQLYGWNNLGEAENKVIINDEENRLNMNNKNFLAMKNASSEKAGIENRGFLDGISIEENESYNISFYAKAPEGYGGRITVRLAVNGEAKAEESIYMIKSSSQWYKYSLTLKSPVDAHEGVTLQVLIDKGEVWFDMISMFPENTYNNRENGMRRDLGEMLEALQPKFLRFPGGCIIEGNDRESAYDWKDSIGVDENREPLLFNGTYGDVAARLQSTNLWTNLSLTDDKNPSFMTYGLGFYEYFLLCEDLGAVGVPVLNCGLYCQMRGRPAVEMYTPEFQSYIDDMIDLVEFCRGDENTVWGKVRIAMGHEEPFTLKYICIGNENEGDVYFERYSAFLKAFNEAKAENPELYEGLELIYSAGTADGTRGGMYLPSYEYAKNELDKMGSDDAHSFAGATDQHYYNDPIWFLKNTDYYDEENYRRDTAEMTDTVYGGGLNVFLGEYAAKSNRLEAALAEAAYMTGLERNGDIVTMAAYAPLFGNLTATHWSPDLIWFNNHQVTGSISYYAQQIFSVNQGTAVLKHDFDGARIEEAPVTGKVGVGTWYTSAEFDNVKVTDNESGKVLAEDNFSIQNLLWNWETPTDGKWKIRNGRLNQTTTEMAYTNTGSVAYFGDKEWSDYTFTVDATKTDGEEGFLIHFGVQDTENNYFWNIGGWGNTRSTVQKIENNIKTEFLATTNDFTVETGKTYEIKLVVSGTLVKGYIDGELQFEYDFGANAYAETYTIVSTDETGDIIVKFVNTTDSARVCAIDLGDTAVSSKATVYQLKGDSLNNDNILGMEEDCKTEVFTIHGIRSQFNYKLPAYSVTAIRIHTK
ncbi:MAG: carbohydrate binding domain-containing protein [Clostridia bacterium]|nr:carbohydrate binding domain-containing protein [Clostridia bacterium]